MHKAARHIKAAGRSKAASHNDASQTRRGISQSQAECRLWRVEKSQRKREVVLLSTISCLESHGYKPTTVENIAKTAGVSRGAIMHHFESRDHILEEAIRLLCKERLNELRQLLAQTQSSSAIQASDEERVEFILEKLWRFFQLPSFVFLLSTAVELRSGYLI